MNQEPMKNENKMTADHTAWKPSFNGYTTLLSLALGIYSDQ